MFKDSLEITINTCKLLLLGFSIYAVAALTKPEELELRTSQLQQWWGGMMADRQEQVSNPTPDQDSNGNWGF